MPFADDQLAILEDEFGRGKHLLPVGNVAIDGDVGARADAKMTEVLEAEAPRRPGAGEDGDLVERVFAGERADNVVILASGLIFCSMSSRKPLSMSSG